VYRGVSAKIFVAVPVWRCKIFWVKVFVWKLCDQTFDGKVVW